MLLAGQLLNPKRNAESGRGQIPVGDAVCDDFDRQAFHIADGFDLQRFGDPAAVGSDRTARKCQTTQVPDGPYAEWQKG